MQMRSQFAARQNLDPRFAAELDAWRAEQDRFPKERLLEFNNGCGRQMLARVLLPGDRYGRNGCLIWGEEAGRGATDPAVQAAIQAELAHKPGIEFFDMTTKSEFDRWGIFTGGRYYVEDILAGRGGLCLDGGTPEWVVYPEPMAALREWAKGVLAAVRAEGAGSGLAEARPTGLRNDASPEVEADAPPTSVQGLVGLLEEAGFYEWSEKHDFASLRREVPGRGYVLVSNAYGGRCPGEESKGVAAGFYTKDGECIGQWGGLRDGQLPPVADQVAEVLDALRWLGVLTPAAPQEKP